MSQNKRAKKQSIYCDVNSNCLQSFSKEFLEFYPEIYVTQPKTGIDAFVCHENIPPSDDRDENGRGDRKYTSNEEENIANHQNQLFTHVQRSMAVEVCLIYIEPTWTKKRKNKGSKEKKIIALQHQ